MRRLRHTLPLLRAAVGLANQPVGAREERHEEQSVYATHATGISRARPSVALVDMPASDEANRACLATITVGPR